MTDAASIARTDQAHAAARELGLLQGAFHKGLIDSGVHPLLAAVLTVIHAAGQGHCCECGE